MSKFQKYSEIIKNLIEEYALPGLGSSDIEKQVLIDTTHHHYQLVHIGWDSSKFIHSVSLHFDIKPDGKIWLQQNWTEDDIALELERRGVQKSDIVIGFHPPRLRKYTAYAEA
jgi:XisI protein